MRRTSHLDTSIHLVFNRSPGRRLDLRKPWHLAQAVDRSDRDPEVTFILGGSEAGKAAAVVSEMLGGVPLMSEAIGGAQSTKPSKEHLGKERRS